MDNNNENFTKADLWKIEDVRKHLLEHEDAKVLIFDIDDTLLFENEEWTIPEEKLAEMMRGHVICLATDSPITDVENVQGRQLKLMQFFKKHGIITAEGLMAGRTSSNPWEPMYKSFASLLDPEHHLKGNNLKTTFQFKEDGQDKELTYDGSKQKWHDKDQNKINFTIDQNKTYIFHDQTVGTVTIKFDTANNTWMATCTDEKATFTVPASDLMSGGNKSTTFPFIFKNLGIFPESWNEHEGFSHDNHPTIPTERFAFFDDHKDYVEHAKHHHIPAYSVVFVEDLKEVIGDLNKFDMLPNLEKLTNSTINQDLVLIVENLIRMKGVCERKLPDTLMKEVELLTLFTELQTTILEQLNEPEKSQLEDMFDGKRKPNNKIMIPPNDDLRKAAAKLQNGIERMRLLGILNPEYYCTKIHGQPTQAENQMNERKESPKLNDTELSVVYVNGLPCAPFKHNIPPYGPLINTTTPNSGFSFKQITSSDKIPILSSGFGNKIKWPSSEHAYHGQKLLALMVKWTEEGNKSNELKTLKEMLTTLIKMPDDKNKPLLPKDRKKPDNPETFEGLLRANAVALTGKRNIEEAVFELKKLCKAEGYKLGDNGEAVKLTDDDTGTEYTPYTYKYMKDALKCKLESNSELLAMAIQFARQGVMPIEVSQFDGIWASGKDGKGKNLLGCAILELGNEFLKTIEPEFVLPIPEPIKYYNDNLRKHNVSHNHLADYVSRQENDSTKAKKEMETHPIDPDKIPKRNYSVIFDNAVKPRKPKEGEKWATVNAANPNLLGRGGISGMILRAAGQAVVDECKSFTGEKNKKVKGGVERCKTSDVRITTAGDIPNTAAIIHTPAPDYRPIRKMKLLGPLGKKKRNKAKQDARQQLIDCYLKSLVAANDMGMNGIRLPILGAGIFKWPPKKAAEIAAEAVATFRALKPDSNLQVQFILYPPKMSKLNPLKYKRENEKFEKIKSILSEMAAVESKATPVLSLRIEGKGENAKVFNQDTPIAISTEKYSEKALEALIDTYIKNEIINLTKDDSKKEPAEIKELIFNRIKIAHPLSGNGKQILFNKINANDDLVSSPLPERPRSEYDFMPKLDEAEGREEEPVAQPAAQPVEAVSTTPSTTGKHKTISDEEIEGAKIDAFGRPIKQQLQPQQPVDAAEEEIGLDKEVREEDNVLNLDLAVDELVKKELERRKLPEKDRLGAAETERNSIDIPPDAGEGETSEPPPPSDIVYAPVSDKTEPEEANLEELINTELLSDQFFDDTLNKSSQPADKTKALITFQFDSITKQPSKLEGNVKKELKDLLKILREDTTIDNKQKQEYLYSYIKCQIQADKAIKDDSPIKILAEKYINQLNNLNPNLKINFNAKDEMNVYDYMNQHNNFTKRQPSGP
jgi:O-acetyl-ADP-ribose deacetylase (regulator of RNase III)